MLRILKLQADGMSKEKIAAELNMTTANVKYHTQQIYKRLGVSNKAGAVMEAGKRGLIWKCKEKKPQHLLTESVGGAWFFLSQSEKTPTSINGEQQIWPWHHGKFWIQIERIWMKMNVCENYTKTEREICELVWLKLNEYDCIIQSWNREAHKSAKERGKAYDLYGNI